MSGRSRFSAALGGRAAAFAPILWERLPELVHQGGPGWWRDQTLGQRLIADAASLAGADAMFVLAAGEAVRSAAAAGQRGDGAIDELAGGEDAARGVELVGCLRAAGAPYAVIAGVPAPAAIARELSGEEPEPAEDAFSDLVRLALEAGADSVAVTGSGEEEVAAGVIRAAGLGELYGRPVVGLWTAGAGAAGRVHGGEALGVVSDRGEWPAGGRGLVITPGDVSGRWSADQLRAAGSARP